LSDLTLKETDTKQTLVERRGRLAELRLQRGKLTVDVLHLELETSLAQATREIQIQDAADRVKQLEASLQEQGQVRSPYNGRLMEVAVLPGQAVGPGTSLATLDLGPVPG